MLFPKASIFVDGGGNDRFFMERYLKKRFKEFNKIYVFEPNPLFHNSYTGANVTLIQKAIWTENCHMPLYLSRDKRQVGSSLLSEKLCRVNSKLVYDFHDKPIDVECVDFSAWLKETIQPYHDLTLKLDIEGAEFAVLRKMLVDNTIDMVNELYVEFHVEHMNNKEEHDQLVKDLIDRGITPKYWD